MPSRNPEQKKSLLSPQSVDRDRFARAVLRALGEHGMTQADLARALGVTQPTVSDYVNAKKMPGRKNLAQIVELLGLDPEDLTAGPQESLPDDLVLIPRAGRAAAGNGYLNGEEEPELQAYSRRELIRLTNAPPERLRAIIVVGDSLSPEIQPNSTVIYLPVETFRGDGLYVLSIDSSEIVKRVQHLPGGALEILPINPDYQPELLLPVEDADTDNTYRSQRTGLTCTLRVVGKVVLYAKPA